MHALKHKGRTKMGTRRRLFCGVLPGKRDATAESFFHRAENNHSKALKCNAGPKCTTATGIGRLFWKVSRTTMTNNIVTVLQSLHRFTTLCIALKGQYWGHHKNKTLPIGYRQTDKRRKKAQNNLNWG
uniref:Uncharacterized protein n=1 Tax=Anopheles quadriannulatus TaxID=34691 RepID=A0A182XQI9_ANOQN